MDGARNDTVAFLFTDIVGSTRLWELYPDEMGPALAVHDELLVSSVERHEGRVFSTAGDGFAVAFPNAEQAARSAVDIQRRVREIVVGGAALELRMGIHVGPAQERDGDFFGPTLNRCARLMAVGHGGQILVSDSARSQLEPGSQLVVRELGEHRLKDLVRPELIHQLVHPDLHEEYPALRTASVTRTNLSTRTTPLFGRTVELGVLVETLYVERLVTITGSGGSGKTTLALKAGMDVMDRFQDGVWLFDLAPISDPALVGESLVQTVGADVRSDRPPLDRLVDFLVGKRALLILDNCERLIGEAAVLAADILDRTEATSVLATSRERLGVRAERVLPLEPFPLPAGDPAENPGVQLFTERARALDPRFDPDAEDQRWIADICRSLDGIPLAIELAAARATSFTPEQIARRLDDRFRLLTAGFAGETPHHRTLRAAIDWTYDQLRADQKQLFNRLGVFAAGFDIDDVEGVAGDIGTSVAISDLFASLVDKSMVVADRGRYRVLDSLRAYATVRLEEHGEKAVAETRHAVHYAALSEHLVGSTFGLLSPASAERLESEIDNLRLALQWSESHDEVIMARLAAALADFWFRRGHLVEGRRWCERALGVTVSPGLRAAISLGLAQIAWAQADLTNARRALTEGAAAAASVDNEVLRAIAGDIAGRIEYYEGDLEAAENSFGASLEVFERYAVYRWAGDARHFLGHVARARGDFLTARHLHEVAAESFQQARDDSGWGYALGALGIDHWLNGDSRRAEAAFAAAQAQLETAGDVRGIAESEVVVAEVRFLTGDFEGAMRSLRTAIPVLLELGESRRLGSAVLLAARLLMETGQPEATRLLDEAEASGASHILIPPERPAAAAAPDREPERIRAAAWEANRRMSDVEWTSTG